MKHVSLAKPHLIVMVGLPGSGKTFFAEKFASTFGAPFVSHAKLAELMEGTTEDMARYQLDELLKTNQTIVYEGATDTRTQRSELAKKARAQGYEPLIVWVQTDQATAKNRVSKTIQPEIYDAIAKRFTPPNAVEKPVVISGKHTYASQAKTVLKRLSAPRAEIAGHTSPPLRPVVAGRRAITIR